MGTVFRNFTHEKRAFVNPEDLTKRNPTFPELCVSTFSENIINRFTSLNNVKIMLMGLFQFIRLFIKILQLLSISQE